MTQTEGGAEVDLPIGRRAMLSALTFAVIAALVTALITELVVGLTRPAHRAVSQVALVPAPTLPTDQVGTYLRALRSGPAVFTTSAILQQPQWAVAAATAAETTPDQVEIAVGVVAETNLITVAATTTSPLGAEAAANALVQAAAPTIAQTSGPYALQIVQPAGGTAVSARSLDLWLLLAVVLGGAAVGGGTTLMVIRARSGAGLSRSGHS
ncbi:MAG: hypothetical protein ABS81_11465 [Pseudonocardia sp. SCN 72-86]|nr:MAG: hypothetical protein ABS81_11465 [Pseudonocardia sp. SCN 72-86]